MSSYPHTAFNLIDQSEYRDSTQKVISTPIFMAASTTDKGPEDMIVVSDHDEFIKVFGEISFANHGQGLLQTARALNAGASVIFKRITSPTSKLANVILVAGVKEGQKQKVNSSGQPLYTDAVTGAETTEATGNAAIMQSYPLIKYFAKSIQNVSTMQEINAVISTLAVVEDGFQMYPLFIVTDIGKGVSSKKFRIYPDYTESKRYNYVEYRLEVIENADSVEIIPFSFDYSKIYNNENISLESMVNKYSSQIRAKLLDAYVDTFVERVQTLSGRTDLLANDILFGAEKSSKLISNIVFDEDSLSLSYIYGINLSNGDNGTFGTKPAEVQNLVDAELVKFFKGTYGDPVYDLDQFKVDAIFDANYSHEVKQAIESLVEFRGDTFAFLDLGFVYTQDNIIAAAGQRLASKFTSIDHLSYDIIDPYSKKQIRVTYTYDLCELLPNHFRNGRNRPIAGEANSMVIVNAIKGTVNFLPKIIPGLNQKEILGDARINYASYYDNKLVLETNFTSQEALTEFSYINNIVAIQEVIKAIRTRCPKIRYTFIDGKDLKIYQDDVESVINLYSDNFREITFKYIADERNPQSKKFKAAINVKFRNYPESEEFDIYALR